jgi:selenide,water dikinase
MALASAKNFEIVTEAVPLLTGAMDSILKGNLNRAHRTNFEYVKDQVAFNDVPKPLQSLLCDAQTSGGLLLAVSESDATQVIDRLKGKFKQSSVIGRVKEKTSSSAKVVLDLL